MQRHRDRRAAGWAVAVAGLMAAGCAGPGQLGSPGAAPFTLRHGLWRMEQSSSVAPPGVAVVCVGVGGNGDAMGDLAVAAAGAGAACSGAWRREGRSFVVRSQCEGAGQRAAALARYEGDFESSYTMDASIEVADSELGSAEARTRSIWVKAAAAWVSPCPAGMAHGHLAAER